MLKFGEGVAASFMALLVHHHQSHGSARCSLGVSLSHCKVIVSTPVQQHTTISPLFSVRKKDKQPKTNQTINLQGENLGGDNGVRSCHMEPRHAMALLGIATTCCCFFFVAGSSGVSSKWFRVRGDDARAQKATSATRRGLVR